MAYQWVVTYRHPDKNSDKNLVDKEAAEAKFKEVYAAYQKLTQPEEEEDELDMDEELFEAFAFFAHM